MMIATLISASALAVSASVQEDAATSEAELVEALEHLETLWLEGRFHDLADVTSDVLGMIEASACPLRNDAALVAFMGGVSGTSHSHMDTPTAYMFWVANEVHTSLGSLPEGAAAVADALRGDPGGSVRTDRFFIQSPYRNQVLTEGCAEDQLSPELLMASPEEADHVFVAIRFLSRSWTRPNSPDHVAYAYPHEEGMLLGERVVEAGDWYGERGEIKALVISPCDTYSTRDNRNIEICRDKPIEHPGFERTDPLGEDDGQG